MGAGGPRFTGLAVAEADDEAEVEAEAEAEALAEALLLDPFGGMVNKGAMRVDCGRQDGGWIAAATKKQKTAQFGHSARMCWTRK